MGFRCFVVHIDVLLIAKGIGESIDLVNIFSNKLCMKQFLTLMIQFQSLNAAVLSIVKQLGVTPDVGGVTAILRRRS